MPKVFAWKKLNGAYCPVLFHDVIRNTGNTDEQSSIVFQQLLDRSEHNLTLKELCARYPMSLIFNKAKGQINEP